MFTGYQVIDPWCKCFFFDFIVVVPPVCHVRQISLACGFECVSRWPACHVKNHGKLFTIHMSVCTSVEIYRTASRIPVLHSRGQ